MSVTLERVSIGQVGFTPGKVLMTSTHDLPTVTTAGYLNGIGNQLQSIDLSPTDIIECLYSYNQSTGSGSLAILQVTRSNGLITLSSWANPGNVLLPVLSNHIAIFNGTSGQIESASASSPQVAINYGSIFAGESTATTGVFGALRCHSGTVNGGYLSIVHTAGSSGYGAVITNASLGQSTIWTIADPLASASKILQASGAMVVGNLMKTSGANGLMADAGFRILSGSTPSWDGGGTTHASPVVGMTATCVGSAVIRTSNQPVSIVKAVPSTDTLFIQFSANPGTNTVVDYIYTTAPSL